MGKVGTESIPKGSGREFIVNVERLDGYEGPVRVDICDVPEGFTVTTPVIIEAGQSRAFGAVYAFTNAPDSKVIHATASASATIRGKEITHSANNLLGFKATEIPKLLVHVLPEKGELPGGVSFEKPLELTIGPGETISGASGLSVAISKAGWVSASTTPVETFRMAFMSTTSA